MVATIKTYNKRAEREKVLLHVFIVDFIKRIVTFSISKFFDSESKMAFTNYYPMSNYI